MGVLVLALTSLFAFVGVKASTNGRTKVAVFAKSTSTSDRFDHGETSHGRGGWRARSGDNISVARCFLVGTGTSNIRRVIGISKDQGIVNLNNPIIGRINKEQGVVNFNIFLRSRLALVVFVVASGRSKAVVVVLTNISAVDWGKYFRTKKLSNWLRAALWIGLELLVQGLDNWGAIGLEKASASTQAKVAVFCNVYARSRTKESVSDYKRKR